jgi:ketosteroid isomerase-like protein
MTLRRAAASIGLLLLVALAAPRAGAAPDASSPAALERELVAAIAAGDLATYDRIVADDYVAFEASGKTTPKAEIVASYRSGARRYTNLEIFDVEERIFGDTAVVSAKTKGLRREGDRDVPNRVRYIRVYAKRDGRWRAVAQMAATIGDADRAGDEPKSSLVGSWGGDGAGMEIAADGARLEFDCAHGTIDGPMRTDDTGSFDANGTYVREGPGPTRRDARAGAPARYRGKVEGDSLSLTVELPGADMSPGTFTLTRGRLPRVRTCG